MNATEFAYWLQGFFELTNTKTLSPKQVEAIKNHLQLVFTKVTPKVNIDDLLKEDKKQDITIHPPYNPYLNPYPLRDEDYPSYPKIWYENDPNRVACTDTKDTYC